mmetsp:Transcript_11863/g.28107  ORF Transcript_11863/g.28107 Transcript_11863/m.28107 type:complete len:215 (-) Transcript_11863:80-724(-)
MKTRMTSFAHSDCLPFYARKNRTIDSPSRRRYPPSRAPGKQPSRLSLLVLRGPARGRLRLRLLVLLLLLLLDRVLRVMGAGRFVRRGGEASDVGAVVGTSGAGSRRAASAPGLRGPLVLGFLVRVLVVRIVEVDPESQGTAEGSGSQNGARAALGAAAAAPAARRLLVLLGLRRGRRVGVTAANLRFAWGGENRRAAARHGEFVVVWLYAVNVV